MSLNGKKVLKGIGGELKNIAYTAVTGKKVDKRNIAKKMDDCFYNARLYVTNRYGDKITPYPLNHETYDNGEMFIYLIPNGMKASTIIEKAEAFSHTLRGEVEIWNDYDRLFIRASTEKVPHEVDYNDEFIADKIANANIPIILGYSSKGFMYHDIIKDPAHVLIGGITGSGKSNLMNCIIYTLLSNYNPEQIKLNLVDLKNGVEFFDYKDVPHIANYIEDKQELMLLIKDLQRELKERTSLIKSAGQRDISGLNIPYIITIFDEFAAASREKEFIEELEILMQQGRAAGLFFIITTQRPEVKNVPGGIKANCGVRIALSMRSSTDSHTILDNEKASKLPPYKGRGLYQYGEEREFQTPKMNVKWMQNMIKEMTKELNGDKEESEQIEKGGNIEIL